MVWKTFVKGETKTTRSRLLLGLTVGLVVLGAFVAAGGVGAKKTAPTDTLTHALPEGEVVRDRIDIEMPSGGNHTGWIEIESWSWGVTQSVDTSGGGGATGRADFQEFAFTKRLDRFSPMLAKACAMGQHIKEATLEVYTTSEKRGNQTYLQIKMQDILITSYQISGQGGDALPMESISMNYAKIEFKYMAQDAGGTGAPSTFAYDLQEGKSA